MSQEPILNFNVQCLSDREAANLIKSQLQMQCFQECYDAVENFKRECGVINDANLPVTASITNFKPFPLKDIAVTLQVIMHVKSFRGMEEQPITVTLRRVELESKMTSQIILFNMGGIDKAILKVMDVNYIGNGERTVNKGFKDNTPFLIDTNEITNRFGGFKSEEESETYFLLKNYVDDNLYLRGLLLNMMYNDLEAINAGTYQMRGKPVKFPDGNLIKVRALIQIDIISRIMMYIEDFIILLLANLSTQGNYYKLLDARTKDDPDLGKG